MSTQKLLKNRQHQIMDNTITYHNNDHCCCDCSGYEKRNVRKAIKNLRL